MQITDVRVRRIDKEGKMRAIVSVTFDNEFVVHDIKVIEGEKGLFIAMPSRKAADGEYRDIAHPINSATRDMIQNIILAKYEATALEEIEAECARVHGLGGSPKRIFLGDGNAFVFPAEYLLEIIEMVRKHFPEVRKSETGEELWNMTDRKDMLQEA